MSRLPEETSDGPRNDKDVDDIVATYCILKKESAACSKISDNYFMARALPPHKKMFAIQLSENAVHV